jgi:hypothetical protein
VKTYNPGSRLSTSHARPFIAIFACLLLVGCASTSKPASSPRAGSGIVEFRRVTQQAHRSTAAIVDSLLAMAREPGRVAPDFDRAFNDLELTSIKARARAEALIARGQNYFDEWKEHLAVTNQPSAEADYHRLYRHFTLIREHAGKVRDEFRPFMVSLRQFRARLDQSAVASVTNRAPEDIDALTAGGRRVLENLDALSIALDAAEAEVRAHASKP